MTKQLLVHEEGRPRGRLSGRKCGDVDDYLSEHGMSIKNQKLWSWIKVLYKKVIALSTESDLDQSDLFFLERQEGSKATANQIQVVNNKLSGILHKKT